MSRQRTHNELDQETAYYPVARTEDLVLTESDQEVLIYDKRVHHIHHLNSSSRLVFDLADGTRTIEDIRERAAEETGRIFSKESIQWALMKLTDLNLLRNPLPQSLQINSSSRRSFLKKTAIAGMVAPATIVSISAPAAASSHSNTQLKENFEPCFTDGECRSGFCNEKESPVGGFCLG